MSPAYREFKFCWKRWAVNKDLHFIKVIGLEWNIQSDGIHGHSEAHFKYDGQGRSHEEMKIKLKYEG